MLQQLFGTPFKKFGVGAMALAAVLLTSGLAPAATLTWDPAMDGSGSGGTGNWDVTTPAYNWVDLTVVPWVGDVNWTSGNNAVFGGTGGAVTVDAAGVSVGGDITFDAAGYSLYGGNVTAHAIHFASTAGSTSSLDMYGSTSITTTPADNWMGDLYLGENGTATVTMHGSNTLSGSWDVFVGANGGSVGTLNMYGTSMSTNAHAFWIADQAGSTGHVTMNDHSQIYANGNWGQSISFGHNGTATLDMHDYSSIGMNGDIRIGDFGSCIATMDGHSAINMISQWSWFDIGRETGSNGSLTMSGNSSVTVNDFNVGNSGTGYLEMNGSASVQANGTIHIGRSAQGSVGSGTVLINGGTLNSNNNIQLDNGPSSITMNGGTMSGNGDLQLVDGTCSITQTAGAASVKGWLRTAMNSGSTSTYDISGGTLTVNGSTAVGEVGDATLNIHGTANVSTGFTFLGFTWWSTGGNATINISDTASLTVRNDGIVSNGAGTKTINLNGGTLNVRYIASWGGPAPTLNLNGGRLQANGSDNLIGWINANVQSGGALIDTNGYDSTVQASLVEDPLSPGGGLTKTGGTGTLTLNGANTYTGLTTVNVGTLNIAGSIVGSSLVNSNATLLLSGSGSVGGGITVNGARRQIRANQFRGRFARCDPHERYGRWHDDH